MILDKIRSKIPGKTLFFRERGADLGREGDGDLSIIFVKELVKGDSICMGAGDVILLEEFRKELQLGHSMLQIGE